MYRFFSRSPIAFSTFILGALLAWVCTPTLNKCGPETVIAENLIAEVVIDDTRPESDLSKPGIEELNVSNPYEIRSFIQNNPQLEISNLWKKLKIQGEFNVLDGWHVDESFMKTCQYCAAETHEIELNNSPGAEVLLRITDGEFCRYLLFEPALSNKYRLVGLIDHDFGRYRMPSHKVLIGGGRSFLIIQEQTVSGSGVAMYVDRIFGIENKKLVHLLDYPAEGHECNTTPCREFGGRISDVKSIGEKLQLEVSLTVAYTDWNPSERILWTKQQKAVFVSDRGKRPYLDNSRSNISKRELESVYDVDTLSHRDLCKYNAREIKASGWKRTRNH